MSGKHIIKAKIVTISGDGRGIEKGDTTTYEGDLETQLMNIAKKFNLNLEPKTVEEVEKVVDGRYTHDKRNNS